MFSDECFFHRNGVFNKHNARFWGLESPHTFLGVPLTSEKVEAVRSKALLVRVVA